MPTHTELFWLSSVSFDAERKEVFVFFENAERKLVKRFKFFPFFNISTKISSQKLEELLLDLGFRGFKIVDYPSEFNLFVSGKKKILCNSFLELKEISNALASCLGVKAIVLEPERAFLVEKDWNYFDCFEIVFSGNDFEVGNKVFCNDFGFVFRETSFREALLFDEQKALSFVNALALSSLLKLPYSFFCEKNFSIQELAEFFLENIYFKEGALVSLREESNYFYSKGFPVFCSFDKYSKLDFSLVWCRLLQKDFFNIGLDVRDCDCCKPESFFDSNVLPDSMVEVVVLVDGLFFESFSPRFANSFHSSSRFSKEREFYKKEYFLQYPPIGPLFRNEKILIPLEDAKRLVSEKKVVFGEKSALHWFCKKNEGFLSKHLGKAFDRISLYSKNPEKFSSISLCSSQSTLNNSSLNESFSSFFEKAFEGFSLKILGEVPFQFCNPSSMFFSQALCNSIEAIQDSVLFKFRTFSSSKGFRVLQSGKAFAYVKGFSCLSLAKSFSKELALPQPIVASFYSKKKPFRKK